MIFKQVLCQCEMKAEGADTLLEEATFDYQLWLYNSASLNAFKKNILRQKHILPKTTVSKMPSTNIH